MALVLGQTEYFSHEPVGCFLRAAAEVLQLPQKDQTDVWIP